MSNYLVISTAAAPSTNKVIETFLREVQRHEDADNVWVILTSSTQRLTEADIPTNEPPTPPPTAFSGQSPEEVGAAFLAYVESDHIDEETKLDINPITVVVLDDRGAEDDTALVLFYDQDMPEDVPEGEWDDERAVQFWRSWRVPMRTVYGVTALLETTPHLLVDLFEEEDAKDEQGVFHYREIEDEIDAFEKGEENDGGDEEE